VRDVDAIRPNDPWEEKLSPAVDGELPADEQALLDAHLATCAHCRDILDELRALALEARGLPEIPPPADLWPGVEARIAAFARIEEASAPGLARSPSSRLGRGGGVWGGGLTLSWPQLAAAGLLLVALSGGGMWLATHRAGAHGAGRVTIADPDTPVQTVSAGADSDPTYAAEVADLERALDQRRGQLDPQTVRTIESNLHIIDIATNQARQALAADPSNQYLKDYLSRTMQHKVDVLKQATVFASTR